MQPIDWGIPSLRAGRAYYWWEVFALLQRTVLTGWLLLIHNDLRFLRLVAALLVSVAFLVAVLACNALLQGFKQAFLCDSTPGQSVDWCWNFCVAALQAST